MTMTPSTQPAASTRWQPIGAVERRVLGVLVEKAKTTPENYPLSLNALRNGCNQKSNRAPLMQLEGDQIEEAIEVLRKVGAVAVVQGDGRVDKYRHLAYEWLGVEKVELAVMAELLLRGAQTVGELRGRSARMEPIQDLGELRPVLEGLQTKGLVEYLTPPGRGAVVTHALYLPRERDSVRSEHAESESGAAVAAAPNREAAGTNIETPSHAPTSAASQSSGEHHLAAELGRLREEVAAVRREFQAVRAEFEATSAQLRRELEELNRQLGN